MTMTTLYLDRRDTRLKLEGRALAVYHDEERRGTVPLSLLDTIVMRSAVSLESTLLAHLADAGIGLLVFGGRNAGKVAVVHGRSHNDGARRVDWSTRALLACAEHGINVLFISDDGTVRARPSSRPAGRARIACVSLGLVLE
jgi:CRISPR/Cas system-associated endonuclease Cas1